MKTKEITLSLSRNGLVYDVENIAYVLAESSPSENERAKELLKDAAQEGNKDRVEQIMGLAFKECENLLYPYTKREIEDGAEFSDSVQQPETYVLNMKVPSGFASGTAELLTGYVHEYIVYRVLENWLSLVFPESSPGWTAKKMSAEESINRCKNFRFNRVRRTQTPF